MYFRDRQEAGIKLASEIVPQYRYEDTAVLALSPGGVAVGREIAIRLHARMSLLLTEPISMPGFGSQQVLGLIDQQGHFTYNNLMPTGLLMELMTEMHNYIEAEKLDKLHRLTRAINEEGLMDPHLFYGHHIIIVGDGLKNGLPFTAAVNFLKPISTRKIIAAVPNVSVQAVDRLHILADEIHVLDVLGNYLDTDHYFEDNTIPDVHKMIDEIVHQWQ